MNLDSFMGEAEKTGGPDVNIIDASQLIIATVMANFEPDEVNEAMLRHLIFDTMRNNVKKFKAEYPETIIAFDDSKDGYWRRDLAWYYKKNRSISKEESKWDWDALFGFINKIVDEMLTVYPGVKMIKIGKTEADDIIAILTKLFTDQGRCVMISSSDSDFTQLHKFKGVKQYSPAQKKSVKPKNGSPKHDLFYKIIKGDGKDGVAGIKCRSTYVIDRVEGERAPPCSAKWIESLVQSEDPRAALENEEWQKRWDENVKLLDLSQIPDHVAEKILTSYNNCTVNPRGKLYSYFVKNRLTKLLTKVNQF
ncbi:rnh RNaseH ribonuclease [Aeromonas phage 31]|uniref:RNaseH ribonuclease n=4 Tax=Biquartavirus TaxID=1912143 RepID=Q6U984_9CAUD|nr:RNaseH ribonuclease [Aeromonas phage 44RR2.8t]YP_238944.1 RnaseH [Aeromonas phage 31]APU00690.1 ribonuclease H [Aeromonas phage 44RR2.8t.2]APU01109.1 ribonuclease H [Aeromonas phage 31.2]APU02019.1 ribonuclease H [Aeromonas phage L9-6]APU02270.1 ribonuclease H [Aeromonas phage Riv-10]UYD59771.1 ribonuclease H [Aeromonas phage avDM5]UYD60499.1 ribonuclease H [Aeromonas phage avDM2]